MSQDSWQKHNFKPALTVSSRKEPQGSSGTHACRGPSWARRRGRHGLAHVSPHVLPAQTQDAAERGPHPRSSAARTRQEHARPHGAARLLVRESGVRSPVDGGQSRAPSLRRAWDDSAMATPGVSTSSAFYVYLPKLSEPPRTSLTVVVSHRPLGTEESFLPTMPGRLGCPWPKPSCPGGPGGGGQILADPGEP